MGWLRDIFNNDLTDIATQLADWVGLGSTIRKAVGDDNNIRNANEIYAKLNSKLNQLQLRSSDDYYRVMNNLYKVAQSSALRGTEAIREIGRIVANAKAKQNADTRLSARIEAKMANISSDLANQDASARKKYSDTQIANDPSMKSLINSSVKGGLADTIERRLNE